MTLKKLVHFGKLKGAQSSTKSNQNSFTLTGRISFVTCIRSRNFLTSWSNSMAKSRVAPNDSLPWGSPSLMSKSGVIRAPVSPKKSKKLKYYVFAWFFVIIVFIMLFVVVDNSIRNLCAFSHSIWWWCRLRQHRLITVCRSRWVNLADLWMCSILGQLVPAIGINVGILVAGFDVAKTFSALTSLNKIFQHVIAIVPVCKLQICTQDFKDLKSHISIEGNGTNPKKIWTSILFALLIQKCNHSIVS